MAFDLGAMLKEVSDSDTGREQIEYIPLDLIDSDKQNFYSLDEIESLARNIATVGLQQPIRLRPNPAAEGRYVAVSGHRRRAALNLLVQDDPERWREVACIVERGSVSPAMQQLRLIFANSDTRKMSSADLNEQTAQVEKLLYQLQEEGYEFPGRMRDHVAEVVQVSKTKLAVLKVIRENLAKCWQPRYKKNNLAESVAYALAQLPVNWQQNIFMMIGEGYIHADCVKTCMKRFSEIEKLKCKKRSREFPCQNMDAKRCRSVAVPNWETWNCGKCCSSCPDLASCKYACPLMADKIKRLKSDKKEARRQEKEAQEEKDRPQVEKIKALWQRFGEERARSGKTVKAVKNAINIYYYSDDAEKYQALESGTAKISTGTKLPYNCSCYLSDISRLIALADLFGCSIDYLLCRTDVREVAQAAPERKQNVSDSDTWQTGEPASPGEYLVLVRFAKASTLTPQKLTWNGTGWEVYGQTFDFDDVQIYGWVRMPKVAE